MERETDAWRELAVAVLESGDSGAAAVDRLETSPPTEVTEMWPFHAIAMYRSLRAAGEWRRADFWRETIVRFPFPAIEGDGFTGSALPCIETMAALESGDLGAARAAIARADAALPIVVLLVALIDIASGNPRAAIEPLGRLREQTRYLRNLDLWRLTTSAQAFLALGDEGECLTVLAHAVSSPGGIRDGERLSFSPEVRRFAEERIDGWPRTEPDPGGLPSIFEHRAEALTERELGLLRALATGRSRARIAEDEFISINTLKAHLRAIYRKVGATSRAEAILEAERRGLV